MARKELTLKLNVGKREIEIKAMDAVGPEDCFDNLFSSVLHRYVTGEDLTMPIPRDVKDFMIRLNLFI